MALIFDGDSKLIVLDVADISVQEIYSRWVDWLSIGTNSKYEFAMRFVGGDPISVVKNLGITYFMTNGWRVRPMEANHRLTVGGNLFTDPSGFSPFVDTLGAFNVTIEMAVSSLVDSTVAQLPEIQQTMFGDRVCIDPVNGQAGTAYPIGTHEFPVNNLSDLKIIAATRGIRIIQLLSDLTIIAGDNVDGMLIKSDNWLVLTIESGASTTDTEFERTSLYGVMSGNWNVCVDCWVYEITNFAGWLIGGSFVNIVLAPYNELSIGQSYIDNTTPMYPGQYSVVTMNQNTSLACAGIDGNYEIRGVTAGSLAVINFAAGKLLLDSSCAGGVVKARGNLELVNNSTGTSVDDDTAASLIWQHPIEGTYTAKQVLRIMSAVIAGNATGLEGATQTFKDLTNSTTRVTGSYALGTRTTTLDVA